MHLVHRRTCRSCGSSALTRVIDLGEQYLQGSFVKPGKESPPMRKIPMWLVRCDPTADENACGLLQMAHSVPPEILYSVYWYRSGTNRTMRDHLRGIASQAADLVGTPGARVLDIGCNDGTLLRHYPDGYEKYGVDPSDVALQVSAGIHVVQDLFPSEKLASVANGKGFDVVTSIAMFYDVEDPVGFVSQVKRVLDSQGVWIFELSYMPSMLELNSYDTICHEHLEYYSLAVLEHILKRAGMKIFDASLNDINGGSIRCFATHANNFRFDSSQAAARLAALRKDEFDLELDTDKPYRSFQERINQHRDELTACLKELKRTGKKIHIYGASTKGNTILQWCGIDKTVIDCAAERSPEKYGATTLGTGIPIVSEAQSRSMKPDYYLVLPWHFKQEFMEREKEMLEQGVGFIFPLPVLDIVNL